MAEYDGDVPEKKAMPIVQTHKAEGKYCRALFDFTGSSAEDLPFKKDDVMKIIKTSADPNWWCAELVATTQKGMVPVNYVELMEGGPTTKSATLKTPASERVLIMPWFHGKIDRSMAEQLLTPRKEGLYLIRESTNYPGDYTLCVCSVSEVEHYRIQYMKGKMTIDEEVFFNTLEELIEHYRHDSDGLSTLLTVPLLKQGGREFKVDAKKFAAGGWEILPRDILSGAALGSGQFGDVFEGTHKGVKVAIKTLKNVTPQATEEFLAEADVMTKLQHQNLVQLIGVCTANEPIMIVSEFMAKGCMLDYLRSRGRSVITATVQLGFTKDICRAMNYLEQHQTVHRDLAARNILISQEDVAKVADFGLAKDSRLGQVDIGKLPIKWTAPEALRNKVSTSKSDVWSYGVVLWEIYSFGRAPYPKKSAKEVVDQVAKGYRMEMPESCPKDLYQKVILKCWELDAGNRPTFKVLCEKLEKFVVKEV